MSIYIIFLSVLFVIAVIFGIGYTLFNRTTKNFLVKILKQKRYVVCHLRYANTQHIDIFNVVPESDFLTKVKSFSYLLDPKYAVLTWKKRLHFVLDENNSIPVHFEKDKDEDILFQAMEIQTSLDNNVTEYLFTKRKEILIIGLFIVAVVSILASMYCIIQLGSIVDKVNTIGSMVEDVQTNMVIK